MNNDQWKKEATKCLVLAYSYLNAVRARDAAPPGYDPDDFSEEVDRIDRAVMSETGEAAHCHKALYSDDF